MGATSDSSLRLAFGPFELDAPAGELRKRGVPVKVSGQPVEILRELLAHPGEVVTREQLRQRIWNDGTFVDFEGGLNAALAKLRRALGDSAENPRYIETVPGRGYRFIGSLQKLNGSGPSRVPETATSDEVPEPEVPVPTRNEQVRSLQRHKRWWTFVAAVVGVSAILATLFLPARRTPALTSKDTIVLASFRNTTGDSVFDGTLHQALAVQLEESPFLSLVSEERVAHTLELMGRTADAKLTLELAREVCERTGSAAVLEGSIAQLGNQYVLGLSAKKCTGDTLDEEQAQAAKKEDVLNALAKIAKRFRTRAGESLATIRAHETSLAEATTPSLDALKAYSTARKTSFSSGFSTAVPLLQRAITLDPQFAMAHAFLGRIYNDIGESSLSAESTRRAYQLRAHASDREKFFITFSYDRQITGNLINAQKTLELWAETYPRDAVPHSLLSGFSTIGLAQYERAIKESEKAIELDPDTTPAYLNLAVANLALGRLGDAESALARSTERKLDISDSSILRYSIAFLKGDRAGMDRELLLAKDKPGAEDWMLHLNALVAAYSGHLQQARILSRRAIDLARHENQQERAAAYHAGAAIWEGLYGNRAAAKQSATAAVKLSDSRDVEYGVAFALAVAGDPSRSETLANDLERRFPDDTFVKFTYGPTLRALCALSHHRPSQSIDLLQAAVPYDLALPQTGLFGLFGGLYPVYVRGQAYLFGRQGSRAANEYQKVLDHRGIVLVDPTGAIARLQLGRALALSGDTPKARAAYGDFLALWKEADPDIPLFKQAKAEFARLQ